MLKGFDGEKPSNPEKPEHSSPMPAEAATAPLPSEPVMPEPQAKAVPDPGVSRSDGDITSAPSAPVSEDTRRSRVLAKSGPLTMFRPAAMKHDDLVEVMREVVPQLIDQTMTSETASGSERKREASE